MTADQGAFLDLYVVPGAAPFQQSVGIARRDEGPAPDHGVIVLGFLDRYPADFVEACGKGTREVLRHVLDDDDARRIERHRFQEDFQGFRAAGGRADHDHLFGGLDHGVSRRFGQDGVGGKFRRDLPGSRRDALYPCLGGSLDRIADDHP